MNNVPEHLTKYAQQLNAKVVAGKIEPERYYRLMATLENWFVLYQEKRSNLNFFQDERNLSEV